jgi:hemin uptake protein HemP
VRRLLHSFVTWQGKDHLVTESPLDRDGTIPDPTAEIVLDARQIFQGRKEIVIEHEGVRYRLRLTRRNKLILQK